MACRGKFVSLRTQLRCRLTQALEAAFDCIACSAIGVERNTIHALNLALDEPDIIQYF